MGRWSTFSSPPTCFLVFSFVVARGGQPPRAEVPLAPPNSHLLRPRVAGRDFSPGNTSGSLSTLLPGTVPGGRWPEGPPTLRTHFSFTPFRARLQMHLQLNPPCAFLRSSLTPAPQVSWSERAVARVDRLGRHAARPQDRLGARHRIRACVQGCLWASARLTASDLAVSSPHGADWLVGYMRESIGDRLRASWAVGL